MLEGLRNRFAVLTNIPAPTLGGKQVWADQEIAGGWRKQKNILTGHTRVLDPKDVRRAWGAETHCAAFLDNVPTAIDCPKNDNPLIVLVHGLGRSKDTFFKLRHSLEDTGYDVLAVNYPSLFAGIESHAEQLNTILEGAKGHQTVVFVTHSLGALVVRQLLSAPSTWRSRITVAGVIMIAPPNQGSILAEKLSRYSFFRWVAGPSACDARVSNNAKIPALDVPNLIIAGSNRAGRGLNPWLAGDDDGIVRIAETRLTERDTVLRVKGCHTYISNNTRTVVAVHRFLRSLRRDKLPKQADARHEGMRK